MNSSQIKLIDTGFATVTINEVTLEIDLLSANNNIAEIQARGLPAYQTLAAIAEYITSLGYPTVSHTLAREFVNAIVEEKRVRQGKSDAGQDSESPN
jgi:hypothetical protein